MQEKPVGRDSKRDVLGTFSINIAHKTPESLETIRVTPQIRHFEMHSDFTDMSFSEWSDQERLWETKIDLSVLGRLPNLETVKICIKIGGMEMDISPLASCKRLHTVEIINPYYEADLTPLVGCTRLKHLRVKANNFATGLNFLPDIPSLTHLGLEVRQKRFNFSPVGQCESIVDVTLSCWLYLDASPLGDCPNLRKMRIGPLNRVPWNNRGIGDGRRGMLNGVTLPSSSPATHLDLSGNRFITPYWMSEDNPLGEISKDEQLDISQIEGWHNIEEIDLSINRLVFFELPDFKAYSRTLPSIDLRQNQIIAINLKKYSGHQDRLRADNNVIYVNSHREIVWAYAEAWEKDPGDVHYSFQLVDWLDDLYSGK